MSWNDKGGGPWGPPPGANNEPRRPQPPGKGPDDLEALLRKGHERLNQMLPGNGRNHLGLIAAAIIVGLIVLGWLLSGWFRVDPNEVAVVQRFGAFTRLESLGLHYHLPSPIETVTFVDVTRRNQTEVGSRNGNVDASTMLTGDSNIVEVDFVVVWQVRDPAKYLFRVADPVNVLRLAAESAMREVIGQTNVQPALNEGRGLIETQSAKILQTTLDRYDCGIQVAAIQLQRVYPPAPVVDAFHDVQSARTELEQLRNTAEAYANKIVPEARGQAQQIIQDASGYKERSIAEATGEAQQFLSILEAYQKARDVTARRMYIETMESVLEKARKIVIDPNADGKNGVVPYLPLPALPATASQPAAKGQ